MIIIILMNFVRCCLLILYLSSHESTAFKTQFARMSSTKLSLTVTRPAEAEIEKLGVKSWPTWGCNVSKFPWTYEETETALLLKGVVTVTPTNQEKFGPPVTLRKGDFVVFPSGMSCTWDVTEAILKHYNFS